MLFQNWSVPETQILVGLYLKGLYIFIPEIVCENRNIVKNRKYISIRNYFVDIVVTQRKGEFFINLAILVFVVIVK